MGLTINYERDNDVAVEGAYLRLRRNEFMSTIDGKEKNTLVVLEWEIYKDKNIRTKGKQCIKTLNKVYNDESKELTMQQAYDKLADNYKTKNIEI